MRFRDHNLRFPVAAMLCAVAVFCYAPASLGQETSTEPTTPPVQLPADLTSEQVDDLVARLSDAEVRQLLLQQLDKVAAAKQEQEPTGTAMDRLAAGLTNAEDRMREIGWAMLSFHQFPGQVWDRITAGSDTSTWTVLLKFLLFLIIGAGVEQLFRRSMLNIRKQDPPAEPLGFKRKAKLALARLIVDAIAIIVFMIATVVAELTLDLPTENAYTVFTSLLFGIVVYRLVAAGFRFVLSPKVSWIRLVNLDDADAGSAYDKLMLVSAMLVFLTWLPGEVLLGIGFDQAQTGLVGLFTSVVFICTLIVIIWQLRPATSIPENAFESEDYFARNWYVLAIIGVVFFYFLALCVHFSTGEEMLQQFITTLVVIGLIPLIDMAMRGWASRFMRQAESKAEPPAHPEEMEATEEGPEPAVESVLASNLETDETQSYESAVVSNLRIVLFVVVVLVVAEIWDLNLFGFLQALVGERAAGVLVNISITGLLAYALWSIVSTAVARIAGPEPEAGAHAGDAGGGGGGSRLGTVLPLFKKFLFITLIVMLVMIVLSSLGVDIGPLIAGAGILGIAIGFGAQTLVKDIVSGLFFLLDDAFRVGEYVTIGDTKGTVEKISVRSLRLRHHNGPLHTVPFGEIQTLTNWSRDWAIMKFEIRVPFETDVDMVRRIIKKVGAQMMEDPELGPFFLAPMKSQGVNRMDDSSFIIRCKFTAIPGNQFYIRREAYMRIQRAFEEKGIKFAPRRVIVETTSPDVDVKTAAAAAGALDTPGAAQDQGKDEPG